MLELDSKGMPYVCVKKTCTKTVILHCLGAIFKSQNVLNSKFGGAYGAPPDPLAGGEGARCPLPKNPSLLSALRASSVGPSGVALNRTPLLKFDKYSPG